MAHNSKYVAIRCLQWKRKKRRENVEAYNQGAEKEF